MYLEKVRRRLTLRGRVEEATVVNKRKVALWALRNPRARGLIMKGLKNRRVRGLACDVRHIHQMSDFF